MGRIIYISVTIYILLILRGFHEEKLLVKNVIVSITLALSDFISFILSLYIALDVLSLIVEKNDYLLLTNEIDGWFYYIGFSVFVV